MQFPTAPGEPCAGCQRAKAYRLPLHSAIYEGRSARDWQQSVLAYLKWRAGESWRPARHRGVCAAQPYRDAIRLVSLAFAAPLSPTRLPGESALKGVQHRRRLGAAPDSREVA